MPDAPPLRIVLAEVRGFCAGVQRAINIVEKALERFGPPIYVRHEIVHNRHVVERLSAAGVVFIEELDEAPPKAVTIFSAHGVSPDVVEEAKRRTLKAIDATCPLVIRTHQDGARHVAAGREVILIGHEGHPEVEGTLGWLNGRGQIISKAEQVETLCVSDPDRLAYVTQTTLSIDDAETIINALKRRFPNIQGPDLKEICYATQNRQRAVALLSEEVDLVLVVGAPNSSNSRRLCEISRNRGVPAHLIEEAGELDPVWLSDVSAVGVTAGASAPDDLVQDVIKKLAQFGPSELVLLPGKEKNPRFRLPREVTDEHAILRN